MPRGCRPVLALHLAACNCVALQVFPESTEEVAAVVAACAEERTPVVPYGAGTSIEGHVGAVQVGACLGAI